MEQNSENKYYVPCLGCDGKVYSVSSSTHDVVSCDQCNLTGRQEVSKEQYDTFWNHFKREDFQ
jgi:hypothetical protein